MIKVGGDANIGRRQLGRAALKGNDGSFSEMIE